jgi:hypothetical protein
MSRKRIAFLFLLQYSLEKLDILYDKEIIWIYIKKEKRAGYIFNLQINYRFIGVIYNAQGARCGLEEKGLGF